jgi:hypothetical protein
MYINPSWNYDDIVYNLRTLRLRYEEVLASFNYVRDENKYIKATRDNLYAMNLEEFQKDRIWEYMNGYLSSFDTFALFGFFDLDEED